MRSSCRINGRAPFARHLLVPAIGVALALSHDSASALASKNLDRKYQPVVGTVAELQLSAWNGLPAGVVVAYRYTASSGTWENVPVQIDQRYYRDFGQDLVCVGGQPACACTVPKTCHLCEMSYAFDGEPDPDDASGVALLDDNDEVVFLVKDTGDEAPATSAPPGLFGMKRYRLRVGDTSGHYGWIYLYHLSQGAPASAPYVAVESQGSGATQQTTFRVCDHPLLAGLDGYQIGLKGNWSLNELRVDSRRDCTVPYAALDVVDRVKWRADGESEASWDNLSVYKGTIAGPVRVVRGSIGAASGFGTTHYFQFYPTWFVEDIHLRVHRLGSGVKGYIDWMREASDLGGRTCPVANFEFWHTASPIVQEYIDGCDAAPFTASAFEARQLNGPYLSLVELMVEDPQHPFPTSGKTMYYVDDADAPLEPGIEDEQGAYGNVGLQFGTTSSTQEDDCSQVHFARLQRIWQVKRSDSGSQRAIDLNRDVTTRPLEIVSAAECPGCGGTKPRPTAPCTPSLMVDDPGVGTFANLSIASPCGTEGLWFRAYRSLSVGGPYELLASLRKSPSFKDYRVERGRTYRYYAESYNAEGKTSAPSDIETATVTDSTAPRPPAISGTVSGARATLRWNATEDTDLVEYNVYRATKSGGPYTNITVGAPIRDRAFTAALAPRGTTSYFIVKALGAAGVESAASNEVALTAR